MSRSCKGGTWVHVVPYTDPNSADGVAPTRTCRLCVYDFEANSLAPLNIQASRQHRCGLRRLAWGPGLLT